MRMIVKGVPAASPVYMVYDNRDRLVLTQDGKQRATSPYSWTFTKYDVLNRPILTGIKDTANVVSQTAFQAAVNAHYEKPDAVWGEKYGAAEPIHGGEAMSPQAFQELPPPMGRDAAWRKPQFRLGGEIPR